MRPVLEKRGMKCVSKKISVFLVLILITTCGYIFISNITKSDVFKECDSVLRAMYGDGVRRIFRHVPDTRDYRCPRKFPNLLDQNIKVSIIITYHNESLLTLLTTIYTIYKRTPPQYLQEIILIDDASEDDFTFKTLDQLTCPPFNNDTLLRTQRNGQRWGLINSRNMGARMARGNYLMFMDSHCEVNQQWLEPLLQTIIAPESGQEVVAVSPLLDNIDVETGEYKTTEASIKGGFDWNLHFHWIARDKILNPFTSFRSPTFAGGVFLISRNWFFKLKAFNTRLEIWGGESLEFSLKVWMCAGQIRIVPCSRVGHIFRKEHIFKFPHNDGQSVYLRNSKVIAETWLDHYKYNFYNRKPEARNIPINLTWTEIHEFKESLNCHTFDWYLKNVFPELRKPENFTAYGILSISTTSTSLALFTISELCLHHDDNEDEDPVVTLVPCFTVRITKWFLLKSTAQLQSEKGLCLSVSKESDLKPVVSLEICYNAQHQRWQRFGLQLKHSMTGLCLEITVDLLLTMNPCRREAPTQYFRFNIELEKM